MDPESLRLWVEQARYASVAVAFVAGLLFSVNPVAIAAIPVALAYATRAPGRTAALRFGAMFILGMLLTHALLGLAAGLGGLWIERLLGRFWGLALGPVLMLVGLVWGGWLRVPLPALSLRDSPLGGGWGAFALGVPFSVAICPVCTPALVALLGVVAAIGSPWLGVLVLLAFALGRSVPVAFGAWALGSLRGLRPLARLQHGFDVAAGLVMMAAGLYMLNAYLMIIPAMAI